MATSVLKRALVQCFHLRTFAKCNKQIMSQGAFRCFSASRLSLSKLYFTEKHEYIDVEQKGDVHIGTVGLSNHAQELLGEVVYVELQKVGAEIEQGDDVGVVESVKAASEVYCPASGTITEVNEKLDDEPKLINESWLEKGWLFKMKISRPEELENLLDEDGYKKFLEETE